MTINLLEICARVASDAKLEAPTSIIGNNDLLATQLLQCIKSSMSDLLIEVDWEVLEGEATINTANGTSSYALPSDFDRIDSDTAWNATRKQPMIGVVSKIEWQSLLYNSATVGAVNDYYRIKGGRFHIYPTPTGVEVLKYTYIQNTPIASSSGTAQEDWLADTDIPRLNPYIVELATRWRFRKMNGKPYAEDLQEYNKKLLQRTMVNGGRKKVFSGTGFLRGIKVGYPETIVAP